MLRMTFLATAAVVVLLVVPAFAGPKAAKAKDNCEGKACCKPAATAKKVDAKKTTVKSSSPSKPSTKKG